MEQGIPRRFLLPAGVEGVIEPAATLARRFELGVACIIRPPLPSSATRRRAPPPLSSPRSSPTPPARSGIHKGAAYRSAAGPGYRGSCPAAGAPCRWPARPTGRRWPARRRSCSPPAMSGRWRGGHRPRSAGALPAAPDNPLGEDGMSLAQADQIPVVPEYRVLVGQRRLGVDHRVVGGGREPGRSAGETGVGGGAHCIGVRELSRDLAPRMARIRLRSSPACLMAMLRLSTS